MTRATPPPTPPASRDGSSRGPVLSVGLVAVSLVVMLVAVPLDTPREDAHWRRIDTVAPMTARGIQSPVAGVSWRIRSRIGSGTGTHTVFEQTIEGRPLVGSWAVEHELDDGTRAVTARFAPHAAHRAMASSSSWSTAAAARAVERTTDHLAVTRLRAEPTAAEVWAILDGRPAPAYRVTLPAESPLGDFVAIVDAESSTVRSIENHLCHLTGDGRAFLQNPALGCGANPDASDADLAPFVSDVTLDRLDGSGYLDGDRVRAINGDGPRAFSLEADFRYPPSHPGFEQAMCYFTIDRYFDHVESLGVGGFGGRAIVADARGYSGDNSFFSPATGRITLGIGGVPDAQDPEIILHELGHALHHRAQPAYSETSQSRAVSEGIADYLACSFTGDPYLAEWDAAAYSSACPPHLRRLDRFRRVPEDLTGSVHGDGTILASALWALRPLVGPEALDRAVLESLFFLLPDSDVTHAARVIVETGVRLDATFPRADAIAVLAERGLLGEKADVSVGPDIVVRVFPSPARSEATFRFALTDDTPVSIDVFDVRGRRVATLLDGAARAGSNTLTWNLTDVTGSRVAGGVYAFRIHAGARVERGKLLVLP